MSDPKPAVSVIIPSYNCESYIAETIESVLNQTFRDFELIVVDDGSTDRTCEIVKSFGSPIRFFTQVNARVCAARNRGIEEARGEFICLLDHDDYWFPDKLSNQVKAMQAHPEAGVVFSAFTRWNSDAFGKFPDPSSLEPVGMIDEIDPDYSGWIYHQFLLDCWMLTSTTMIRAEVFNKCGTFDVNLPYSEDWDLWLRITREYPFIMLRRATTLYRQHPDQGNLVIRDVDYRTELLSKASKKWGLKSRDDRFVPRLKFQQQLAKYHAAYGLHQLQSGNTGKAVTSFAKALFNYPLNLKYSAYILAAPLGWKPKW